MTRGENWMAIPCWYGSYIRSSHPTFTGAFPDTFSCPGVRRREDRDMSGTQGLLRVLLMDVTQTQGRLNREHE